MKSMEKGNMGSMTKAKEKARRAKERNVQSQNMFRRGCLRDCGVESQQMQRVSPFVSITIWMAVMLPSLVNHVLAAFTFAASVSRIILSMAITSLIPNLLRTDFRELRGWNTGICTKRWSSKYSLVPAGSLHGYAKLEWYPVLELTARNSKVTRLQ